MWFGMEYGLVWYDGYSVKIFFYELDNFNSFVGNVVIVLVEDY